MSSLSILKHYRRQLLLAEAIGWLHDYRKCSEEHLRTQAPGSRAQAIQRSELANRHPSLASVRISFPAPVGVCRNVSDLLDDRTWSQDVLGQLLERCHNTAHFDKQEPVDGQQNFPGTQLSSPFGFEQSVGANLTNRMWALPWGDLNQIVQARSRVRLQIIELFPSALADSRRPINEVDLWSWGLLVGALYKSALAGALLTGVLPSPSDLKWRLLSVRVDGLRYLSEVSRVPDLRARQRVLEAAFDQVCSLVEVIYPLGGGIYRDQNGLAFVAPDIPDLLDWRCNSGKTLRASIESRFVVRTAGELLPEIYLEPTPWWGQDPNWSRSNPSSNDKLPDVKAALAVPKQARKDVQQVAHFWSGCRSTLPEVCPVCRLRPKLPDGDACAVCDERRVNRARDWTYSLRDTIWLDEVADEYGRVALVAGAFRLDDWLSGQLVQTLLVKADPANNAFVPKNPSPARLRRVWETTQRFWQEALDSDDGIRAQLPQGKRLRLTPHAMPAAVKDFHTYDLIVAGRRLSVLRCGQAFITCDNRDYVEKLIQARLRDVLRRGQTCKVWTPAGYGERTDEIAEVVWRQDVEEDSTPYAPVIPILSDPQVFMALVPARCALAAVKAVKAKYEREMGKVRNRLPLTLGVVYFGRRTPLAAALEAARRMIERPARVEPWEVRVKQNCGEVNNAPVAVCLALSRGDRTVTLSVPTLMGDNTTPDDWYPYWRVEGKPTDRRRWFVGPDNEHWVHVAELRPGDRVDFAPSTFDYEFLDTTARRFEVLYDQDGARRLAERRHRPYLLEELDLLEAVWGQLTALPSKTQTMQLVSRIEAKREAWGEPRGTTEVSPAFRQFVRDALLEAGAPSATLAEAAVRGWLADLVELHFTLQKEHQEEVQHPQAT